MATAPASSASQARVAIAIKTLRSLLPDYAERTLTQRQPGPESCGSVLDRALTWEELAALPWEEYIPPVGAQADCTYFRTTAIGGQLGVVNLTTLPVNSFVTLDDRKDTGKVSAVVKGVRGAHVDFVVAILGEEQGQEVLFTFHPGDPVSPSRVQAEPGLHGKSVTVSEALAMGLTTAKIA